MAIKPIKPVSQTTTPITQPTLNRGGGVADPTANPRQAYPTPLPQLIQEQPLPNPTTDQYNQIMALYQQALGQNSTYGSQMLALQNQINQMTTQAAKNPYQRQLMSLYQGDPFSDLRAKYLQALQGNQPRLNQLYYVGNYSDYG